MKLTNKEYISFREQVKDILEEYPMLRRGQVMFNVLSEIKPEMARDIMDTDKDPFYDDSKIPEFIKYINE